MKMMIVDDDRQIREGIRDSIAWDALGVFEVFDEPNGRAALKTYQEVKPDLILADIKMPQMDGIELLKEIRKTDKRVRYVILSAYSDFSYAQEALRMGASGYELKPIKIQNLIRLIKNLVEEMKAEDASQRDWNEVQNQKFLAWLAGNATPAEESSFLLQNFFRRLPMVPHHYMILTMFEYCRNEEAPEKFWSLLLDFDTHILRIDSCRSIGFLHSDASYLRMFEKKRELKGGLEKLIQRMNAEGIAINIGVSDICTYKNLPAGYEEARQALEYAFYTGENSLHFYEIVKSGQIEKTAGTIEDVLLRLLEYTNEQDYEGVKNTLALLRRIIAVEKLHRERIEALWHRLAISLEPSSSEEQISRLLKHRSYLDDYCSELDLFLRSVMADRAARERQAGYSLSVRKILEYISRTPVKELSPGGAADYTGKSPNYLSAKFKKELGVTLMDYMTDIRLTKARQLLTETDLPVSAVMEQVGYHDYAYFSKLFKKRMGFSASFVRKNRNRL